MWIYGDISVKLKSGKKTHTIIHIGTTNSKELKIEIGDWNNGSLTNEK